MIDAVEHPPDVFIPAVFVWTRDIHGVTGMTRPDPVNQRGRKLPRLRLLHAESDGGHHNVMVQLIGVGSHSGINNWG
jgi:hypothetical protein